MIALDLGGPHEPLFDVLAVEIKTGKRRLIATAKTQRNAEAVVKMAVMRRGVDVEFFTTVSHPSGVPA